MTRTADRIALVTGATGVVGRNLIAHVLIMRST